MPQETELYRDDLLGCNKNNKNNYDAIRTGAENAFGLPIWAVRGWVSDLIWELGWTYRAFYCTTLRSSWWTNELPWGKRMTKGVAGNTQD